MTDKAFELLRKPLVDNAKIAYIEIADASNNDAIIGGSQIPCDFENTIYTDGSSVDHVGLKLQYPLNFKNTSFSTSTTQAIVMKTTFSTATDQAQQESGEQLFELNYGEVASAPDILEHQIYTISEFTIWFSEA